MRRGVENHSFVQNVQHAQNAQWKKRTGVGTQSFVQNVQSAQNAQRKRRAGDRIRFEVEAGFEKAGGGC